MAQVTISCEFTDLTINVDETASCVDWTTQAVEDPLPQLTTAQYAELYALTLVPLVIAWSFRQLYLFILNRNG